MQAMQIERIKVPEDEYATMVNNSFGGRYGSAQRAIENNYGDIERKKRRINTAQNKKVKPITEGKIGAGLVGVNFDIYGNESNLNEMIIVEKIKSATEIIRKKVKPTKRYGNVKYNNTIYLGNIMSFILFTDVIKEKEITFLDLDFTCTFLEKDVKVLRDALKKFKNDNGHLGPLVVRLTFSLPKWVDVNRDNIKDRVRRASEPNGFNFLGNTRRYYNISNRTGRNVACMQMFTCQLIYEKTQ